MTYEYLYWLVIIYNEFVYYYKVYCELNIRNLVSFQIFPFWVFWPFSDTACPDRDPE